MSNADDTDELEEEYDFTGGERGKYAARYAAGTNVIVLDPDVARRFKTSEEVNDALRKLSDSEKDGAHGAA